MEAKRDITHNVKTNFKLRLDKISRNNMELRQALPFVGLLFIFLFFLIATRGRLVAASNLSNLIEQCFTITLVAVGASFIYACGLFDISIGAVMALSELSIAYLMKTGDTPIILIILIAIGTAVFCTIITSIITSVLKVNVFVSSLCMMFICNGIVTAAVSEADIYISFQDYKSANSPLLKAIVLIVMVGVGWVIFNKTRLGRDLKALGGNETAAALSGVRKVKTYILAFVCLGVCIGIAGFFSLIRVSMLSSSTGGGLGLNIFVAIVLGGFPLTGGSQSRMISAIVGALTLTLLQNGLSIMSMDPSWTHFIQGILFLIIVGLSYDRSKGKFIL
ncbi:MAG TPA: ABC transporter permease [Clostridiaceae bacterium]|nr:ABC transporter permease [Clostridiaceae bacterium]